MLRYGLDIAYQGTHYHGWQIQNNAHAVQHVLNNALSQILNYPVETVGSGRTDTGVHALQQIVHMDLTNKIDTTHLIRSLNAILPLDIVVKKIIEVDSDFHARHSAISRSYEYRITSLKNPFLIDLAYYFPRKLNVDNMNKAAKLLLKYTDFRSFCKSHTDTPHYFCNITSAEWIEQDNLLIFKITSNRFLRGMVRAIVGTLLEIGLGRIKLHDFEEIINSKNRQYAGAAVPACGLFLTKVVYTNHFL